MREVCKRIDIFLNIFHCLVELSSRYENIPQSLIPDFLLAVLIEMVMMQHPRIAHDLKRLLLFRVVGSKDQGLELMGL